LIIIARKETSENAVIRPFTYKSSSYLVARIIAAQASKHQYTASPALTDSLGSRKQDTIPPSNNDRSEEDNQHKCFFLVEIGILRTGTPAGIGGRQDTPQ
jgi:hypothetical protein